MWAQTGQLLPSCALVSYAASPVRISNQPPTPHPCMFIACFSFSCQPCLLIVSMLRSDKLQTWRWAFEPLEDLRHVLFWFDFMGTIPY